MDAPTRLPRRAPVRVGHPRTSGRVRDRQDARHQGASGRRQDGHRCLQRGGFYFSFEGRQL